MIEISRAPKRYANGTACHLAPVLLVVAWGVAWIGFHALQHVGAHTLFQTLALAESVIALLLRRRKPDGSLLGILIAYFAFQLDPLLLPNEASGASALVGSAIRRHWGLSRITRRFRRSDRAPSGARSYR